ncbi:hypothetical protein CEV33_1078 [Brucella grignonensis]|uniref:Uncharacterized protein n=1 Tax=Brucella grignonensis TaxID=94627 RepID=A0A256FBQ5_9HYPH|nr:hypothetical protein CEV33_1078 [Brucella grignonensis]
MEAQEMLRFPTRTVIAGKRTFSGQFHAAQRIGPKSKSIFGKLYA